MDICQWRRDTNSPGRRPGRPKTAFPPARRVQCSRSIRPVVDRPPRSSHGLANHIGKFVSRRSVIVSPSHAAKSFERIVCKTPARTYQEAPPSRRRQIVGNRVPSQFRTDGLRTVRLGFAPRKPIISSCIVLYVVSEVYVSIGKSRTRSPCLIRPRPRRLARSQQTR